MHQSGSEPITPAHADMHCAEQDLMQREERLAMMRRLLLPRFHKADRRSSRGSKKIQPQMHADGAGGRHARPRQKSRGRTSRAASASKVPSACICVHLRSSLLASLRVARRNGSSRGYRTTRPHAPIKTPCAYTDRAKPALAAPSPGTRSSITPRRPGKTPCTCTTPQATAPKADLPDMEPSGIPPRHSYPSPIRGACARAWPGWFQQGRV
jgi:hypothetical protein